MAFLFFLTCSLFAGAILVPINYRENGTSEGVPPPPPEDDSFRPPRISHGSTLYLTSHLVFTYLFTILAIAFLQHTYARYIPLRQLFSLELAHSIPARTVMATLLPPHLRSERALAEYFEGIHIGVNGESGSLGVESVSVVRAVGGMKELLERRTKALRTLEEAWCKWLGNPVPVEGPNAVFGYEAAKEVERILDPAGSESSTPLSANGGEEAEDEVATPRESRLVDFEGRVSLEQQEMDDEADLEARLLSPSTRSVIIHPTRKRPTLRPRWFARKVDALDFYAEQFRIADDDVTRRRKGKFRPTGVAFVTFESLAAAVSPVASFWHDRD